MELELSSTAKLALFLLTGTAFASRLTLENPVTNSGMPVGAVQELKEFWGHLTEEALSLGSCDGANVDEKSPLEP